MCYPAAVRSLNGWVILAVCSAACVPHEREARESELGEGGAQVFVKASDSARGRTAADRERPGTATKSKTRLERQESGAARESEAAEERLEVVPPPAARPGAATAAAAPAPAHAALHGEIEAPSGGAAGRGDPLLTETFHDQFERLDVGADFRTSSNAWYVKDGRLCAENAKNHPIWLKRRLPKNARIQFEAQSLSHDGDVKLEVWGDGASAATSVAYSDASSYILIYGGWKNRLHVLARLDEHGSDRLARRVNDRGDDLAAHPVGLGTWYEFKVERNDGETVRWYVDDIEIHALRDPEPLHGPGHDHFGFNDWQARVCFDNLAVTPLGD